MGIRAQVPEENLTPERAMHLIKMGYQQLLDAPGEYNRGRMWSNGMRSARPLVLKPKPRRALVVGCSCTWGQGVNDEQTFVWLLNQKMAGLDFDNAGVSEYGPYRCLLNIEHYLKQQKYDLVLYCAIENHFYRDCYYLADRYLFPTEEMAARACATFCWLSPIAI